MSRQPFQALALALARAGRRLGPGELADVQVVFDQPGLTAETLRAQMASLLARDAGEWARVATLVDHWLAGELDAEGRIDRAERRRAEGLLVRAEPAVEPPVQRTLLDRLVEWSPRRLARTFVIGVGAASVVIVVGTLALTPPVVAPVGGGGGGSGSVGEAAAPSETSYTLERSAAEARVAAPVALRLSPVAWVVLSVVALGLWAAGARLRRLPPVARQEESRERDIAAVRSRDQRAEIESQRFLAGAPEVELWQVPVYPAVAPAAVVAAASTLLRARVDEGRPELDLRRTLRDTLDAGGRFSPALTPRALPARLLVWVEVPAEGEHAWSRRLDRVLDGLATLGLEIERWEYAEQPDRLRAPTGPRLDAVDVGRRTAGWPVLILGRALSPWSRDGRRERPWMRARRAWARMAWVDPDPSGRTQARLDAAGVRRFPFTELGLETAARWLVGDAGVEAPEDPPVAALPEDALWRWALAAAMVPEAGWDQLEAVRRGFSDLARDLPGPWAVRGLLAWVARQPEAGGEAAADGPRLLLPRALEDRLLREYRARAPSDPELRGFVDGVNRMLLDQLGADAPSDAMARALWELKTGWIRARVEPARAAELLARVMEGPLADEARDLLARELSRQADHPVPGADWREVDRRGFEGVVGVPEGVPARSVLWGAREAWPRARAVLAAAAAFALAGAAAWWGLPLAARAGLGPKAEAVLPPTYVLKEETGELRPAMVRIEAGSFTMGSPRTEPDRQDEEGPVEVQITRPFLLAATEVTQAQYRRVMGEEPWGDTMRGDDLPAHTVSWEDALRYCNRLSEREHLAPAYDLTTDPPSWKAGANGYRLPTEAEWEYAARAGTSTRFVGTEREAEVCAFDNVAEGFGCDDGYAGLAPVGHFRRNAWGLLDVGGNVFEWVWDAYDSALPGGADPHVDGGLARVYRGGSWFSDPRYARVAYRWDWRPSYRYVFLGFRPARSFAP